MSFGDFRSFVESRDFDELADFEGLTWQHAIHAQNKIGAELEKYFAFSDLRDRYYQHRHIDQSPFLVDVPEDLIMAMRRFAYELSVKLCTQTGWDNRRTKIALKMLDLYTMGFDSIGLTIISSIANISSENRTIPFPDPQYNAYRLSVWASRPTGTRNNIFHIVGWVMHHYLTAQTKMHFDEDELGNYFSYEDHPLWEKYNLIKTNETIKIHKDLDDHIKRWAIEGEFWKD